MADPDSYLNYERFKRASDTTKNLINGIDIPQSKNNTKNEQEKLIGEQTCLKTSY